MKIFQAHDRCCSIFAEHINTKFSVSIPWPARHLGPLWGLQGGGYCLCEQERAWRIHISYGDSGPLCCEHMSTGGSGWPPFLCSLWKPVPGQASPPIPESAKNSLFHTAYLTYIQRTSWETLDWKKHKLESRLPGEISTSDMQMSPRLWQKAKKN